MSRRSRKSGYTLIEVVIALAIFGIFLGVLAQLTREMTGYEKRLPVNFLSHPQVIAVLARLRRDVLDATMPYYPESYAMYSQSPTTLILYTLEAGGNAQTIVWDFSNAGEARRRAFSVGNATSDWIARGVPKFTVSSFPIPGHPDSVRVRAYDKNGLLAVDQIFQPRAHE